MATPRQVNDIARALIATAHDERKTETVVADLAAVAEAFRAHPDLLSSLRERTIPIGTRARALREALKKDIHPFVINALLSLQHAELLDEFPAFCASAVTVAGDVANHHEVAVRTAVPLEPAERKELSRVIEKKFEGTHRITETVDPGILGGLIVDAGDWHVDASVKGKLDRLKQALNA